jgi:superkiller protein 3
LITRAITILELAYEEAEDPEVERRFAVANSNLGRLRLSMGDYQGAIESFESVLGLLEDATEHASAILCVQVHSGLGIANFMLGNLQTALVRFEAALANASHDPAARSQVSVLYAQALWAIQGDEFKETAKEQLLQWYVLCCLPGCNR